MAKERKVLVVHYTPGHPATTVDNLTEHLNDDWRIVSTTAMGGTGGATSLGDSGIRLGTRFDR